MFGLSGARPVWRWGLWLIFWAQMPLISYRIAASWVHSRQVLWIPRYHHYFQNSSYWPNSYHSCHCKYPHCFATMTTSPVFIGCCVGGIMISARLMSSHCHLSHCRRYSALRPSAQGMSNTSGDYTLRSAKWSACPGMLSSAVSSQSMRPTSWKLWTPGA